MSASPRGALVRRTIDLNYENKKRAASLKWVAVNGILFLLFAYDLCRVCPGHTTILHHVELALALVALANLVQYAVSALPRRRARLALSPRQQRLLGLRDTDLDRSMEVSRTEESTAPPTPPDPWPVEALALSMCAQRRDTSPGTSSPLSSPRTPPLTHSPHSGQSPHYSSSPHYSPTSPHYSPGSPHYSPGSPHYSHSPQFSPHFSPHQSPHTPHYSQSPQSPHSPERFPRDEFIADRRALADYLRNEEARSVAMDTSWAGAQLAAPLATPLAPPVYQLATVDTERGTEESARGSRSPPACRRLHLDPQRLTEFDLNLRLWVHATILSRVVREAARLEALLGAAGGERAAERLQAAAAAGPAPAACCANLAPFLEPFADQRYAVQRIRELSRGGCLSGYKWDGGGGDWEDSKPTDAELVLQLFASYLDTQLPGGGAGAGAGVRRPFSDAHVTAAPQPAPRGPRALAIHRVTRRPPHYVLALGDETIEVCRGRDNMLRTLLVFIAAAARSDPPALQRVHLGRAGLNLLWVIGR